jgi:Zinc finger, C2H2 type
MTDVLQCPYCDLRFSTRSELEQHQALDHRLEDEDAPETAPPKSTLLVQEPAEQTEQPTRKGGFLRRLFKRA